MAFKLYSRARSWIVVLVLFALLGSGLVPVTAQSPSIADRAQSVADLERPGPKPKPKLQLVGHVPGIPSSLFIDNGLAALTYWGGIELLDVSHPAAPRGVGFLPTRHNPIDVVLDQDYAYLPYAECGNEFEVNGCNHGMLVLNIADPTALRVVSDFATLGSMDALAEQDGIVLTGGYTPGDYTCTLSIIDVANPAAPREISKVESFCDPIDIKVYTQPGLQGHRLAFVTCRHGIAVVDITNPQQPVVKGDYSNQGAIWDAALYLDDSNGEEKPFLYLAIDHRDDWELPYAGLVVLDVSAPADLKEVAFLDAGKDFHQVATHGGMLYAATDQGIASYDLTSPVSPQPSGVYSTSEPVWVLYPDGHFLYMANYQDGLQILDLSNPAGPVLAGSYDELSTWGEASLVGRTAYVPSDNGLEIWDLFNPVEPRRVGTYEIPSRKSLAMAVSGDYALVSDRDYHTWLLDVSNPITPVETARLDVGASSIAITGTVGVAGSPAIAYIGTDSCDPDPGSGCDSNLLVVDISQPVTPTVLQRLSFQGLPDAIVLSGKRAFVTAVTHPASDGSPYSYLSVYDISAVTLNPIATNTPFTDTSGDLVLCGSYACVATWNGLIILDISNLADIHEIGRYTYTTPPEAPSGISSMAIDGPFAYLTDLYNSLLVVVDISDPTRPRELARLQMPGGGDGVTFSDGYLYASNGVGGLSIYQTAESTGKVRDVNGRPFSGVAINSDLKALGASGLSGAFTLDAQSGQALTLKPQMLDYAFWPPERTIIASDELSGQDFTILAPPVSVPLAQDITTTLSYTDTAGLRTEFDFPAGGVPGADGVIVTPTVASAPPGLVFAGHAFELAFQPAGIWPQDAVLGSPISASIAYSRANIRLVSDEMQLNLYRWDGQAWVDTAPACPADAQPQRDLDNHLLRFELCQAGRYALMGPTLRQFMPLVILRP
jgi:hypothetical protein